MVAQGYGDSAVRGRAAKALLDAGASVNAKDSFGRTPLYYTAWNKCASVSEELLRAGAEPLACVTGVVCSALMDKFISMV
jgi:ankyrin repeat protein